jgi:predicted alpha/beta hydrolase family esterase
MTRQVLFVQGGGAPGTHDEWDNKLVESLERELGPDYKVFYPRMPNEADPKYARWKAALEKEFAKLDDGAILTGHSIGGTILINVLADDPPSIALGGVFLIAAPFVGDGGWPSNDIEPRKKIGAELPEGIPIYLYHGSEDDTAPFAHVDLYAKAIPQAIVRRLKGRNHQLNDELSEVARDIKLLG